MARVLLGLGANLGNREENLKKAVGHLRTLPHTRIVKISRWRETEPVGGPPQGAYLNGAAELHTELPPLDLMAGLLEIENRLGRKRDGPRWGPRVIDLDMISYDGLLMDEPNLTLPHPRAHLRRFILEPLAEIAPDWRHPRLGRTADELLDSIPLMRIVRSPAELRQRIRAARKQGKRIGFVPTMGALHEGHLSLIRAARRENGLVVVSVFVNPIQFNKREDLRAYPRALARDARLAGKAGADILFAPSARAVYPPGFQTFVEVTEVSSPLEGKLRPGHFRGVATVVAKLFNMVQPDSAYFGQKDAQQARVVRQLIRDLDFPIGLRILPTVREPGGLAMSSRNARLSTEQRRAAGALFEALQSGKRLIECGHRRKIALHRRIKERLARIPGLKVEYIAVVDPENFKEVSTVKGPVLILTACRLGETRLIDNVRAAPRKKG